VVQCQGASKHTAENLKQLFPEARGKKGAELQTDMDKTGGHFK